MIAQGAHKQANTMPPADSVHLMKPLERHGPPLAQHIASAGQQSSLQQIWSAAQHATSPQQSVSVGQQPTPQQVQVAGQQCSPQQVASSSFISIANSHGRSGTLVAR